MSTSGTEKLIIKVSNCVTMDGHLTGYISIQFSLIPCHPEIWVQIINQ